jgi:hypothetical protein
MKRRARRPHRIKGTPGKLRLDIAQADVLADQGGSVALEAILPGDRIAVVLVARGTPAAEVVKQLRLLADVLQLTPGAAE